MSVRLLVKHTYMHSHSWIFWFELLYVILEQRIA